MVVGAAAASERQYVMSPDANRLFSLASFTAMVLITAAILFGRWASKFEPPDSILRFDDGGTWHVGSTVVACYGDAGDVRVAIVGHSVGLDGGFEYVRVSMSIWWCGTLLLVPTAHLASRLLAQRRRPRGFDIVAARRAT